VAPPDAAKHAALALVADARAGLEALAGALNGWHVDRAYTDEVVRHRRDWEAEVERIVHLGHTPLPSQGEVIGAVNEAAGPRDVVVCAAGSLPGDLHKLWRTRDPGGYHLEYGYSTMGYEVAGGLGVKLADPSREVFVMVGDGSWLMLSSELVTARQEGVKLIVILVDNHGFASIGSLSRSLGSDGFGTAYRSRGDDGRLSGGTLEIDFAANARSLGVEAELRQALAAARAARDSRVVVVETDPSVGVPGYESWWDVPVAEVSDMPAVGQARQEYERGRDRERSLTTPPD
jgi:3D-(3,5/4)-trihydroxycyclohexane-1,2-dione acylhydrolase (decyclizing)